MDTRVTHWIDFRHFGFVAYRIWTRDTGNNIWQQRHEWRREDGEIQMDEWIRSTTGHCTGGKPVSESATPEPRHD